MSFEVAKKDQTPSQVSAGILQEYLKGYGGISESEAKNYSGQMLLMDTLPYMNMRILAAAIVFLHRYQELSKKTFIDDNIKKILVVDIVPQSKKRSRRIEEENGSPPKIIPITEENFRQYKPSLLRYIHAVDLYRENLKEIERENIAVEDEPGEFM